MAPREDGMETRRRLLEAACEVFAEKGYRAATIADICGRAKANVAAVNYYFGDKETLYQEAWEHSFRQCAASEPPDPNQGDPEDLLQDYIHTLLENFAEKSSRGYFTRLYLMEMANPTGLVKEKWKKLIEP
ncbi:MAG: TetR/AcrR family transcriptional regulator, partial [Deltaproteobacteria bacterium]|nr:TetR/AcrR family transcriptional regulator [Deltaproteobacteria bacterium]